MSDQLRDEPETAWPDYRSVWRWHFYASLFCIPFVVILTISGSIYLFKNEVEDWLDRPYDRLEIHEKPATAADQIRAALAAVPDATLDGYELPKAANTASRVIVRQNGEAVRVYVHPETLQVLHMIAENDRFMPFIRDIHGELLAGDRGSMVVELAACWTVIMILTGLYLWWPRHARGFAGVLYPRLSGGRRMFWRDLHAVTGVWVSSLALFLLLSGLPWAKSWGSYLKTVRRLTGAAVAKQDWTVGSQHRSLGNTGDESGEHSGHSHHGGSGRRRTSAVPKDLSAVDRIVAAVRPLNLPDPVVIAPPEKGSANWSVKSLTPNRPQRIELTVDGASGRVVSRQDFRNRHLIDQVVQVGIAAHEGRLFGWPNQLLGLLTAAGLDLMCVSGIILWWRRREQGVLGAPKAACSPQVSMGLIGLVVLFGIYMPLFGASLVGVLLLEKLVLCRITSLRVWLGLRSAEHPVVT